MLNENKLFYIQFHSFFKSSFQKRPITKENLPPLNCSEITGNVVNHHLSKSDLNLRKDNKQVIHLSMEIVLLHVMPC